MEVIHVLTAMDKNFMQLSVFYSGVTECSIRVVYSMCESLLVKMMQTSILQTT